MNIKKKRVDIKIFCSYVHSEAKTTEEKNPAYLSLN